MKFCPECGRPLVGPEAKFCGECGTALGASTSPGPAGVPETSTADASTQKWLELARRAAESENWSEVEEYCNLIIQASPQMWQPWLLKGQAAGWQSRLINPRLLEAANCFARAYELVPPEESISLGVTAVDQMVSLSVALISLRGDTFTRFPDADIANQLSEDASRGLNAANTLWEKTGLTVETPTGAAIANALSAIAASAWTTTVSPEFHGEEHPSDWEFNRFAERVDACVGLTQFAMGLTGGETEDDLARYDNLALFLESKANAKSYEPDYNPYVGEVWNVNLHWLREERERLNNEAASLRAQRSRVNEALSAKKARDRLAAHWASQPERKAELEALYADSLRDVQDLKAHRDAMPAVRQLSAIDVRVTQLRGQQAALGFMKGKEKKALQEQIDGQLTERASIEAAVGTTLAELDARVARLQSQMRSATSELERSR